MELCLTYLDIIIHLDRYLDVIINHYGLWSYIILFLIIFCKTGLVVTPFLPGDSLLFAAGIGSMDYWRFLLYNIVGGIMWILIVGFGGFYFGNIPVVQKNFTLVIFSIIVVSVLPAIIQAARQRNQSPTA